MGLTPVSEQPVSRRQHIVSRELICEFPRNTLMKTMFCTGLLIGSVNVLSRMTAHTGRCLTNRHAAAGLSHPVVHRRLTLLRVSTFCLRSMVR